MVGGTIGVLESENGKAMAGENDSRYQLVQRILATPDFVRSPQLSKFLLYISKTAIETPEQVLSEQHIGVAVFGREPDYDSSADTIVRSHALRLRRRLELYFRQAGRDEPIHLIIPRGAGYSPVFLLAPKVPATGEQDVKASFDADRAGPGAIDLLPGPVVPLVPSRSASEGQIPASEAPNRVEPAQELNAPLDEARDAKSKNRTTMDRRAVVVVRYRVLTAGLALMLIFLAIAFGMHLRTHFQAKRHHLLWGRLFTDDQPTQIVLGDSGLVLFHAVARRYVSLHDYLADDVSKQMPYVEHAEPAFAQFLLHRRYTSVVDATTLTHLMRLPEAIPERTLVHYSRDMHLNDFKTGNIILIGAQEAVPWVELFETHMDFPFSIDNPDKHASYLNRHPQKGELAEYNSNTPSTANKVYAVIAFLPNLSATGNVLLLEGLSMVGTEAAVDLVFDDARMIPILQGFHRPNGSLPHFEMLLESDTLGDGAGPPRVIAVHLHD